jgi:hypothetical protein
MVMHIVYLLGVYGTQLQHQSQEEVRAQSMVLDILQTTQAMVQEVLELSMDLNFVAPLLLVTITAVAVVIMEVPI